MDRTDTHIIHLRQPRVPQGPVERVKKGEKVTVERSPVYPPGAITLAHRLVKPPDDPEARTALVGVAFCSPKESFSRRTGAAIARQRLESNPLTIYVGNAAMTHQLVRQVLRTMLLDPPQWAEEEEHMVLNPHRFNARLGTALIGPDGILVRLEVDARDADKRVPRGHARIGKTPFRDRMSTWALNFPLWARTFLVELQP